MIFAAYLILKKGFKIAEHKIESCIIQSIHCLQFPLMYNIDGVCENCYLFQILHVCQINVWTYTSVDTAKHWVMTLFDLTFKQVESLVAVYKRRVLICRFGTRPLLRGIDTIISFTNCQLCRLTLYQDCTI